MKKFALVPILLLFAFHATATDPTPPAPPTPAPALAIPDTITPVGDYATFAPDASTTVRAVTYIGISGVSPFPSAMLADKRAFVLPTRGLAAGKYVFIAVGSLNDVHVQKEFAVIVGGTPPPQPPGPGPQPGPAPVNEPLWVIVLEESSARTPATAKVIADLMFWQSLAQAGHHWAIEDKDTQTQAVQSHYAAVKAANVSLPALVLVNNAGVVRKVTPLPANVADVKAIIQAQTGK